MTATKLPFQAKSWKELELQRTQAERKVQELSHKDIS